MNFSTTYTAGDGVTQVTVETEPGVNPSPPRRLVPEDSGDLANETPAQAWARHQARVAAMKEITGYTPPEE